MKCPNCGYEQQDGLAACEKCQVIFTKWHGNHPNSNFRTAEPAKKAGAPSSKFVAAGLLALFLFLIVGGYLINRPKDVITRTISAGVNTAKVETISVGETVKLESHLVDGYVVIFDFYAEWCGPCMQLAPQLEELAAKYDDVLLRKIDIVDWNSEVVKQYGITGVPYVAVYNKKGKQVGSSTHIYESIAKNVEKSR